LLIAGSEGKMGAAVLATGAILRSGIGLVSVLVPKIGRDVLQISHPAAMVIVDREKKELSSLPSLGPYQSIGIGPGIGKGKKTQVLVKELLERFVCPLVFDADAINIISENKDWLKLLPQNSILTPHPKEFERLVGKSKSDAEVFEKAIQFSKKFQVFLVLKSAHTLICFPNGNVYFNSTGNPGMAKGGSGDVLTGLITGLLAQGYSSGNACIIGAYIHGLAGDFAAMENGQIGMTVNQLIEKIPQAFMSIDFQSKLVISH
jgi:NAD(P)H-hydrate epimerase